MRIRSGAEEMLLHVALRREVDMIYLLLLSLGTSTTCNAPTRTLQMTAGVIKLLRSDFSLRIAVPFMSIGIVSFAFVYRFIPQIARCISMFR